MEELKIVGWVNFEDVYPTRKSNGEDLVKIIELIKKEIMEKQYVFSGEEHQNSLTGVPVFSDGTCFRASMRCWGSIMSSIYEGPNGEKLTYMDFYMSLGDEAVLPEFIEVNIDPAQIENFSYGCTIKQDRDIIQESLDLGMSFMTTDKVLNALYDSLKEKN